MYTKTTLAEFNYTVFAQKYNKVPLLTFVSLATHQIPHLISFYNEDGKKIKYITLIKKVIYLTGSFKTGTENVIARWYFSQRL